MNRVLFLGAAAGLAMMGAASADPVDLSAYVDANGFIDVQTLSCGQLANTYQEDANALMAWYSGWYNGLAHKHYLDYRKGRETEHLSSNTARRIRTRESFMPSVLLSRTSARNRALR